MSLGFPTWAREGLVLVDSAGLVHAVASVELVVFESAGPAKVCSTPIVGKTY